MSKYQIFTDSCSDLSTEDRLNNNIDYFQMKVVVDGNEIPADLDWKEYSIEEFYGWLKAGRKMKTTQVPMTTFMERMRPLLEQGIDIIYVACSSALSASWSTFALVAEQLKAEFPERKMTVIDSLAASFIEGMMCIDAAKKQKEGATYEEVVSWLEENKLNYNLTFTVDTLKYLKDAGRVKGTAAFFGDIIGVKPICVSDATGNNLVINKVRGTRASLDAIFEKTKEVIIPGTNPTVYIGQALCLETANKLKARVENELGLKAEIRNIGPIIGTSAGPGTISLNVYGKTVTIKQETK